MEIQIQNLTKRYGKYEALKNISLNIPVGMYGLLGKNGAGKTTFMRILSTVSKKTSGEILVGGIRIDNEKEIKKITGYLPQDFSVYPSMSIYEALDYLGVLAEIPRTERKQRIHRLLKQVNLEEEKHKKFKNLSGGMKRRFGIAQALLNDPKVLIADEPTAGLDPEERIRFHNLLSELAEERVVLLSTHIAADIEATCTNVAVLNQGKVIFHGKLDALRKKAENKVYIVEADKNNLEDLKRKYQIINIQPNGIKASCRVISDVMPMENCQACGPTVEDSYMYLLSQQEGEV